jgi:hypothetical protein
MPCTRMTYLLRGIVGLALKGMKTYPQPGGGV